MSIVLKQQTYGHFFFFIHAKSSCWIYYTISLLSGTRCGTICGQTFLQLTSFLSCAIIIHAKIEYGLIGNAHSPLND